MKEILIIKTGYSEVLDNSNNSKKTSFGDVLRTTCLLHYYKNDNITWVSDESAFPLLKGNKYINRLLHLDFSNSMHLLDEEFDVLINLEKNIDICKFAKKIDSAFKYGFRFDKKTNSTEAYDRAFEVLAIGCDPIAKKKNKKFLQELLFEMVGEKFNKEEYILGYVPKEKEKYDICLNTFVGEKWPLKSWPKENWNNLEEKLSKNGFNVSRQDKQPKNILTNLYDYIDWINSSSTIVTNDSLGLHLGIVLKKNVLGLFGPTPHKEIYFYDRGKAILPDPSPDCLPCSEFKCEKNKSCIEKISVDRVYNETNNLVNLSHI